MSASDRHSRLPRPCLSLGFEKKYCDASAESDGDRCASEGIYSMMLYLALTTYWMGTFLAAVAGLGLLLWTLFHRSRWWWKAPLALALMLGPWVLDVSRVRMSDMDESITDAILPTTFLVAAMDTNTDWPHDVVLGRLLKAPSRHELWDGQLDRLVTWADECVQQKDRDLAMHGLETAGVLYRHGRKEAVTVMGSALTHRNPLIRLAALDALSETGEDGQRVRPIVERMRDEERDDQIRRRVSQLLWKWHEFQNAE